MDRLRIDSAAGSTIAGLAALFTRAFAGYAVPVAIDAGGLAAMLRRDGVDLAESLVATVDDIPSGLLLVAPRGWDRRIAAMGVTAEARRGGLGRRLLGAAIDAAAAAGCRALLLEVIADNVPALALYRRRGFVERRRLVGFERAAGLPPPPRRERAPIVAVDAREVAEAVARWGAPGLPWQLEAASLIAHGPPAQGLRLGDHAWALVTPGPASVRIDALVVREEARRRGAATALVAELCARYPGRDLRIPARVPAGLVDPFVGACGFSIGAIAQLELAFDLCGVRRG
jgi:ribosomal protein S18 acetylase RimI-like enzyme